MKKAIAEFIGTFTLVLFGCGAAVIGGMMARCTSGCAMLSATRSPPDRTKTVRSAGAVV